MKRVLIVLAATAVTIAGVAGVATGSLGSLGKARQDVSIARPGGMKPSKTTSPSPTSTSTPPPGFASEQVWKATADDWEPAVAVDPGSNYVYQFTTRYGGGKVCGSGKQHCIFFRASSDGGNTWGADYNMCNVGCAQVSAQNDPVMKVAANGTIYALWMNDYDVVFSKSTNHGATWSTPYDFKKTSGLQFTDKPEIEISPNGQDVYVAFNSSDSYVAASHDGGTTFSAPVKTNTDTLYWFAEGGAVAPNGTVYFAESAENQNATGPVKLAVLKSSDGGVTWTTTFVDTSQQQPACTSQGCIADFYAAQINLAVDGSGKVMTAYSKSSVALGAATLYTRTSTDGVTWSAPVTMASGGTTVGADFPVVASGSTAGDFRVAWQDDRNGASAWNTWYTRTTNSGTSWSTPVRLSNLGSGAAYKTAAGYGFPYGDYFQMAVNSAGTNYVIWSEGTSYAGPGGSWFTKGL